MPQQTYMSPNYFPREIDKSAPVPQGPVGVPAGVIGTANRGPAFVPVTVGNWDQFVSTFGDMDPKRFGPYAAYFFLANRQALTFMRVLGAGANTTATDISRTQATGRTLNAGFHLDGIAAAGDSHGRHTGIVQFLAAQHTLQTAEAFGPAIFTDNDSYVSGSVVHLVRGMVLLASGARLMVADGNADFSSGGAAKIAGLFDGAVPQQSVGSSATSPYYFKLIISSTLGTTFYNDDGLAGCHIMTASFNPDDKNYFGKLLNTNPDNFVAAQHLLYADFAVDDQVATVGSNSVVAVLSGSANVSTVNPDTAYTGAPYNDNTTFRASYGAFDSRYSTPKTTNFISQPFGNVEYDLFAVEALDDGQYANNLFKISIVNLQASTNPAYPYGTFSLQVRGWNDTDVNPVVLEQFNNLSLDPKAENYICAVIGDRKISYNFDSTLTAEQRLVASGKYDNQSAYIRVVPTDQLDQGKVPAQSLPFGFRGYNVLKTNDSLTDGNVGGSLSVARARLAGYITGSASPLTGSIIPPVPFRTKVTKGTRSSVPWFGNPGSTELASPLYYWGVQFERLDIPTNPNVESLPNNLLSSLTQFFGATGLDTYVTGSGADSLNDNKFTLAKVAFSNDFSSVWDATGVNGLNGLTASIDSTMREAAYIRNARLDGATYTVHDVNLGLNGAPTTAANRVTFATLLAKGTPQQFNRFSPYMKFTTFMAGGWDGVNFLDPDARRMNDRSTSFDLNGATNEYGGAYASYVPDGFHANMNGTGQSNSNVASYVTALNVMTDPMQVNHNILVMPGIREPFLTDYAGTQVKQYGLAYYIMDLERRDENGYRLFDADVTRPDVDQTAVSLNTRGIDNNYVGAYFPDVFVQDTTNNRRVKVPASIAALGAIGFNDRVGYPWFAPAGFNRAALDFVTNVEVRLNSSDRDTLYSSRINPIATFPRQGFVIFGQKTLQQKSSALDRVNVRRLVLEVKRIISNIALKIEFEENTPDVRNNFSAQAVLQLGLIQAQAGIEGFQVICNETNNSSTDVDQHKMNGRIVVVPTRVIEFIAIDFIITNSGVQFI